MSKYSSAVNEIYKKIVALLYFVFVAYLTLVMGRSYENINSSVHKINLEPLGSKMKYINRFFTLPIDLKFFVITEALGNLLLFVPFSWALYTLRKKNTKGFVIALYIIIVVFTIESLQYFYNIGTFDIDDLVLNIFGGITGIFLFKHYNKTEIVNEDSNIWD